MQGGMHGDLDGVDEYLPWCWLHSVAGERDLAHLPIQDSEPNLDCHVIVSATGKLYPRFLLRTSSFALHCSLSIVGHHTSIPVRHD